MNIVFKSILFVGILFFFSAPVLSMEQEEVFVEPVQSSFFNEGITAQELLMVIGKCRVAAKAWEQALDESEAAQEAAFLVFKLKKALLNSKDLTMGDLFAVKIHQLDSQLDEFKRNVNSSAKKAIRLSIMAENVATHVSDETKAVCKNFVKSKYQTVIMHALEKIREAKQEFIKSLPE